MHLLHKICENQLHAVCPVPRATRVHRYRRVEARTAARRPIRDVATWNVRVIEAGGRLARPR